MKCNLLKNSAKKLAIFSFCTLLLIPYFMLGSSAINDEAVEVVATSCVLMDVDTGEVLFSNNEDELVYPASVTKIMSLLIFMEYLDSGKLSLDEVVTTSPNAASKGGSQIWLEEGEQMSVDELLRAICIASANDACTALGEHVAGSEAAFVQMLNDKAAELGMTNTNFENCTGLDDDTTNHLTTAYDVALMSCELLSHERIQTYSTVWMDTLRDGATELVNTNTLVRFYEGTTGLKTGTTEKAGYCVSASAERDGLHLVAVVMGAENSTDRFEYAKDMLDWGFANFETYTPSFDTSLITEVKVNMGLEQYITPEIETITSVTLEKGESSQIETVIELATDVDAPVEKNQVVGTVTFKLGDEQISQYNLVCTVAVDKTGVFDMILFFFRSLSIRNL